MKLIVASAALVLFAPAAFGKAQAVNANRKTATTSSFISASKVQCADGSFEVYTEIDDHAAEVLFKSLVQGKEDKEPGKDVSITFRSGGGIVCYERVSQDLGNNTLTSYQCTFLVKANGALEPDFKAAAKVCR